jgi:hypothetical protein
VAATISAPLFGDAFFTQSVQSDNRILSAAPNAPRTWSALDEWPPQVDAYLRDHFGFRAQLVRAYATLSWGLFGTSPVPSVVVGRNDRLFLSDGEVRNRVLLGNCGAWWPDEYLAKWAVETDAALRRLKAEFARLSVLIVPTSAVLYSEDLPSWMEHACAGKTPLVEALAARLPQDTRRLIAYPIEAAKRLPIASPLIPKHNFHWTGQGVNLFMDAYIESSFGLKRQIAPNWEPTTAPADLARFLPGLEISNTILTATWNTEKLEICSEENCLQHAPLEDLRLPRETLRVSRLGDGEPILLLSDSFGWGAAFGLIEYFRDVVMINMNNFQTLEEADRRDLWRRLKENWGGSNVLVLIEDGNAGLLSQFVKSLP